MITKFINYLNKYIDNSIYVWGSQGETEPTVNEAWIRKMEPSERNADRAIFLFRKIKSEGKTVTAFDCSGLIVNFLLENNLISTDTTSRGLYRLSTPLTKSKLKRGDLVFMDNGTHIHHVGVYVGNNEVVHARGRDYGVVKEQMSSDWNKFARYEPLQVEEEIYLRTVIYKGRTFVNIRTEPNSLSKVIGRVKNSERAIILSEQAGWAEILYEVTANKWIRGYTISKHYEVIT